MGICTVLGRDEVHCFVERRRHRAANPDLVRIRHDGEALAVVPGRGVVAVTFVRERQSVRAADDGAAGEGFGHFLAVASNTLHDVVGRVPEDLGGGHLVAHLLEQRITFGASGFRREGRGSRSRRTPPRPRASTRRPPGNTGICRVEHMKPSRPICAALEDRSD